MLKNFKDLKPIRHKQLLSFIQSLPSYPLKTCTNAILQQDLAFTCHTCSDDTTSVYCSDCFFNSQHRDHLWYSKNSSIGQCDCGDETAIQRIGFCCKHQAQSQIQLSFEIFETLIQTSFDLIQKLANNTLLFDIPENQYLIDGIGIVAIFNSSSITLKELYIMYLNGNISYNINESEAKQCFYYNFIQKEIITTEEKKIYGGLILNSFHFRVHSMQIIKYSTNSLVKCKNEAVFDAMIQVLNEPQALYNSTKQDILVSIIKCVKNNLEQNIDQQDLAKYILEAFDGFQLFSFFQRIQSDYSLINGQYGFLAFLIEIHILLIKKFSLSLKDQYDNSNIFINNWYNFSNAYILIIFQMSRFINRVYLNENLSLNNLLCGEYQKEIQKFELLKFKEIIQPLLKKQYFKAQNIDQFPLVGNYLGAFLIAQIIYFGQIELQELLTNLEIDMNLQNFVELLLDDIVIFHDQRLKIYSGLCQKQNILELQDIIHQQDNIIQINIILYEQIFTVQQLLKYHKEPLKYLKTRFENSQNLIQYLHIISFQPSINCDDFYLYMVNTKNNLKLDEYEFDQFLNATQHSPSQVLEIYLKLNQFSKQILKSDLVQQKTDKYIELAFLWKPFDQFIENRFSNQQSLLIPSFQNKINKNILPFITEEFLTSLQTELNDNDSFTQQICIFRLLQSCNIRIQNPTSFLQQYFISEVNPSFKVVQKLNIQQRYSILTDRVQKTDQLLLSSFQCREIQNQTQNLCSICHQYDVDQKQDQLPIYFNQQFGQISTCGHSFHKHCIQQFISENSLYNCPMCQSGFTCLYDTSSKNQEVDQLVADQILSMNNILLTIETQDSINLVQQRLEQLSKVQNTQCQPQKIIQQINFSSFLKDSTTKYLKLIKEKCKCQKCQINIDKHNNIYQCLTCGNFQHSKCITINKDLSMKCLCDSQAGFFCLQTLDILINPLLSFPAPYKDKFGRQSPSIFTFEKKLDPTDLDYLQVVYQQRLFYNSSKQQIEIYVSDFQLDEHELFEPTVNAMFHLGILKMDDFQVMALNEEDEIFTE